MAEPIKVTPGDSWARDIIAAGRLTQEHEVLNSGQDKAVPFVILQSVDGEKVEFLTTERVSPPSIQGTFSAQDVESFLAYHKRFKRPETLVYGSLNPLSFTAVFDEHRPDDVPAAAWREHRAAFVPLISDEWRTWTAKHGQPFASPIAFAEWLQDCLVDVVDPPSGKLQEIALTMRVKEATAWSQVGVLQSGQIRANYDSVVDAAAGSTAAGSEFTIPQTFKLAIPVFKGVKQPLYDVVARLRFRREGTLVKIWYELERPNKVVEKAFLELYEKVKAEAGSVLLGSS